MNDKDFNKSKKSRRGLPTFLCLVFLTCSFYNGVAQQQKAVASGKKKDQKISFYETGVVRTIAGTGKSSYDGDGNLAVQAHLFRPQGIVKDKNDNLYIADFGNNAIRKIDKTTGIIYTICGVMCYRHGG